MGTLLETEPSGNGGDALSVDVAWFPYMKATEPKVRRLGRVLDDIQSGKWSSQVNRLRVILAENGKELYDREKIKLPSFFVSGTASTPTKMLTHSGLIQVDLDNLADRLRDIRAKIVTDPHAAAVFISPSGRGLKTLFRLHPLDEKQHKRAFGVVAAYFVRRYGVVPDPQCKNVNRHCLVSYDPDLFCNATAIPFDWTHGPGEVEGERGEGSSVGSEGSVTVCSESSEGSLCSVTEGLTEKGLEAIDLIDHESIFEAFKNEHPALARLYKLLLWKRQRPKSRERNQCAIDLATFLVRAFDEQPALLLIGHWYDQWHKGRFNDSREQHLHDAKAHWDNIVAKYPETLRGGERVQFERLNDPKLRASFRIFRDLAGVDGQFFISWNELSIRLGVHSDTAGEVLELFMRAEIIKRTQTPVMWQKGFPPRATCYRWLL